MFPADLQLRPEVVDEKLFTLTPPAIEDQAKRTLDILLAELSPDTSWGDRQMAAKKLGYLRCREALPGILDALPADPFWMVRCAMIQAVERIGDAEAIPTLREVATKDGFQVVRSYASKAVERLSKKR